MLNTKTLLTKALTNIAAILIFLAISVIYFSPQLDGKVLPQGDVSHFQGVSQELREYYEKDGESSAWTNSLFSGMPAYQIGIWGNDGVLSYVEAPIRALGNNIGPVFTGMLMAYILFLCMGMSPILAAIGAIAYSLGSYNIIIIDAGHITKAWAIAYMPLIIASMVMMFKKKYLWGGVLMALGLALQIKSNHLQITYYTGILCAFIFLALVVELIRKKEFKDLIKSSAILLVAVVLGVLCNFTNIYANYEMSKESTRGQSELTNVSPEEKKSSGLDKDYAFAWSYGKAETFSLLIPDIHGGSSGGMLDKDSHLYKELQQKGAAQMLTPKGVQAYTYWGDQPFTSGPVYFGAVVCLLFLLGMILIRSNVKWYLLAATIFFIFLSWGKNFDGFNDFMFHNLPYYNKFRTVSMALVIPAITMLIIGIWGLKEFFADDMLKKKALKALYISFGVTAGLSLFFWIAPSFFFNFVSSNDGAWQSQMPDWYYNALLADRKDLLSADAFRSLAFILVAGIALWLGIRTKENSKNWVNIATVTVLVLVFIDLWSVDKRYLNDSKFVDASQYKNSSFTKTKADEFILQDKGVSHRVLNLSNPFNDSKTSYFHKSIGGYHAAKLKRYQELIDNRLQHEVQFIGGVSGRFANSEFAKFNEKVQNGEQANPMEIAQAIQDSVAPYLSQAPTLAMLNTKYIVYHPELPPVLNKSALGNAWFVEDYKIVENADAEMATLPKINPSKTAIIDKRYAQELEGFTLKADSTAKVNLLECKPNKLKYQTETSSEQLLVMSEVFYKYGWKAYIDGEKANHFCADWTLRAMRVPAGKHEIVFEFEPDGYNNSHLTANICSILLILLFLGALATPFIRKEQ